MSRKSSKAEDREEQEQPPVDSSTDQAHDLPVEGEIQAPTEHLLKAPLVVRGIEYAAGDLVTLTPRQARFARGQNCID